MKTFSPKRYKYGIIQLGLRFQSSLKTISSNVYLSTGTVITGFVILMAFLAPFISPYHYAEVNLSERLLPPSLKHPFGTDHYGRDILSRIMYGASIALWVGILVAVVEAIIGIPLGLLAGYFGGRADKIISAFTDMIWAFPPLILALGIVTIIGAGLTQVVIAIAIVSWAPFTRVTRAKTQAIINKEFVLAARAIGESDLSIMVRYILPNIIAPNLVLLTLTIPSAILATTALSFLGFGAQPPTPDWGAMLSEGADYLISAPWIATFPGIFIVITALGFNLLGDGLRDILDPTLRVS